MDLFCWTPDCRWNGSESEADWQHVKIIRDNEVVAELIDKGAFCPKCGGSLYDEADEERAAIKQYDANMTREEARKEGAKG